MSIEKRVAKSRVQVALQHPLAVGFHKLSNKYTKRAQSFHLAKGLGKSRVLSRLTTCLLNVAFHNLSSKIL
jgi:hypothetical protein